MLKAFALYVLVLRGILERFGGVLEASWAVLRASSGVLGKSWGRLGASGGRLEGVLGRLGGVLGRLRRPGARLGDVQRRVLAGITILWLEQQTGEPEQ